MFLFFLYIHLDTTFIVQVSDVIAHLNLQTEGRAAYFQADVCDSESLRKCFIDIQTRYGNIENVIHTAAVISDAILWNIDNRSFENVLRPKVIGAWNLHLITEELCPSLKSFVLLSSIRFVACHICMTLNI